MINVFFLITLTPLDNMARFVIVIEPALIASEIPGTLRSATAKLLLVYDLLEKALSHRL